MTSPPSTAARPRVLLGLTGSVATIKCVELIQRLKEFADVRVVLSTKAQHFCDVSELASLCPTYSDDDEWPRLDSPSHSEEIPYRYARGHAVLHIELMKWAEGLVIAPLSGNSLASIAHGLCNNLLLCIARAWDFNKPLVLAPAMNTRMWQHPLTAQQLDSVRSFGPSVTVIAPIVKILACGDHGAGAMAEPLDIANQVREILANRPPQDSTTTTEVH